MKLVQIKHNEVVDWNQYEKLKYATLLSSNFKSLSDIYLIGSKIIDSIILSSHQFLPETYFSINEVVNIYENWTRKILNLILSFALSKQNDINYRKSLLDNTEELQVSFLITNSKENEYLTLIQDVYEISYEYLRNKLQLSLLPRENGDFELAINQIRKIIINIIKLFGTLVNSLDRIYQYYKFDYGKPILLLNSSLVGDDKLDCLFKFLELIQENIPDIKTILVYIDEEVLGKENLIVCQVDLIINELQKKFKNIDFQNLHI